MPESASTAKLALRDHLWGRRRLPVAVIGERARALAAHLLATPEVRAAATVAAYVSVSHEPGTGPLLDALEAAGKRVVLPLLQPDGDLDWAAYAGSGGLRTARRGLLEPDGPALGATTVPPPTWCWCRGSRWGGTGCAWAAAAGPTTGPWAGCPWAPSPACC